MAQAQSLLTNIQSEILESQRNVLHLKTQAKDLDQAQTDLRNLEEQFKTKLMKRYRLGFEKWLKDEEEREAAIRNLPIGAALPQIVSSTDATSAVDASDNEAKGKRKAADDEDISDLTALYADLPVKPEDISKTCQALREELDQHKRRRKDTFDSLVKLQAESGTSERMNSFRRLISVGCDVAVGEVDAKLSGLLEVCNFQEHL